MALSGKVSSAEREPPAAFRVPPPLPAGAAQAAPQPRTARLVNPSHADSCAGHAEEGADDGGDEVDDGGEGLFGQAEGGSSEGEGKERGEAQSQQEGTGGGGALFLGGAHAGRSVPSPTQSV